MRELSEITGGSSHRGQFATLFGLDDQPTLQPGMDARLASEASAFRALYDDRLTPGTKGFLERLEALAGPAG